MKMGEKDHFDHSDRRTLCHARHLPACYRSAGYHRPGARLLWARVLPRISKKESFPIIWPCGALSESAAELLYLVRLGHLGWPRGGRSFVPRYGEAQTLIG